jgi:hypothetical protein
LAGDQHSDTGTFGGHLRFKDLGVVWPSWPGRKEKVRWSPGMRRKDNSAFISRMNTLKINGT